ncbi:MAG TPA: CBS domain-containing protein [Candidatus Binatia bacterium]|nr:CBS domain-containing protein [Candidatus Binatia bacterium]
MLDFRSIRHMPTIKVAMTTFPYSIDIDAPLADAWAMMLQRGIRHLPVTEDGAIVGVVSERDLRLVLRPGSAFTDGAVRLACTTDAYTVPDDTPLDVVAREMADRQIGCVVVERHGKLVGILTTTDVCRMLADVLESRFAAGEAPDDDPDGDAA